MLTTVLNKSWKQQPTKLQLYGHQSPVSKTIQVRGTIYAKPSWRNKDVLLCNQTHGRGKVSRLARTYIHLLCADTGEPPSDIRLGEMARQNQGTSCYQLVFELVYRKIIWMTQKYFLRLFDMAAPGLIGRFYFFD